MANSLQQSASTTASLSNADRISVENFKQKIAESPGSDKLLKEFNWDGAQRMPARETPVREGLNQSMGKLSGGIEILENWCLENWCNPTLISLTFTQLFL